MQQSFSVPLPVLVVLVLLAYFGASSIFSPAPQKAAACPSVDSIREQVLAELKSGGQDAAAGAAGEKTMSQDSKTQPKKKKGWLW